MPPLLNPLRLAALAAIALPPPLGLHPLCAAEINLPAETARYVESPLPGYASAVSLCMMCHSADYTRMQPPTMNRAAWRANVVKMQKTFGAPIPDSAIDPIADYLVKTYGAEQKPAAPPSSPKR